MKNFYKDGRELPLKNKVTLCLTGLLCFMLFSLSDAWAQSRGDLVAAEGQTEVKPLRVGQKVPEEFWTKEHLFYVDGDTVSKNLVEYRGKLIIFDFWSSWCSACIYHMKKNWAFFAKHNEDVVLLPINPLTTKDNYEKVLTTHQRKFEFSFYSIFSDRYISEMFPIYAYPTYVWINRSGNYAAATMSVSEEYVLQLLNQNKTFQANKNDDQ